MGRSSVSSLIALVVVGIGCLAPHALASARASSQPVASLRVHGAYLPVSPAWDDARWGFGIASRVALNARLGIDFGAARFKASTQTIMPLTVGATYGPEWSGGVRPWVELGAGYYRKETIRSSGVDFDTYYAPILPSPRSTTMASEGLVGGYFGAGIDVPLSGRLTIGTGVRMHAWSDYNLEGLVALQSGLNFGF